MMTPSTSVIFQVFKIASLTAVAAALFSCSLTNPTSSGNEPLNRQSLIYIYRPSNFEDGLLSTAIQVDESTYGELDKCSYLKFSVSAGAHKVAAANKLGSLTLNLPQNPVTEIQTEPNKVYYLRYSNPARNREPLVSIHPFGIFWFNDPDLSFSFSQVSLKDALTEFSSSCNKAIANNYKQKGLAAR